MATATLHKFGDFPLELRIEVWHIFLEDEARSRRVVVWDGRVMPFAHLASPLLRVNVETRARALKFYSTKVDIYSLPDTGGFFPLSEDRLRQLVTETAVGQIEMPDIQEPEIALALAKKAIDLLESAQMTAPTEGALYFSPERDTIIHGYNCGVHLFVRNTSDIHQDLESPSPLWRTFSSKVPTSAFQAAKHVLRVLGPQLCRDSLETSLFKHVSWSWDPAQLVIDSISPGMDLIHPVLSMDENESEDLMSCISKLSKPLPGILEAWFGWEEHTVGGQHELVLVKFETEIERLIAKSISDLSAAQDSLEWFEEIGEEFTSSESYQQWIKSIPDMVNDMSRAIGGLNDHNTRLCARWREHWA